MNQSESPVDVLLYFLRVEQLVTSVRLQPCDVSSLGAPIAALGELWRRTGWDTAFRQLAPAPPSW